MSLFEPGPWDKRQGSDSAHVFSKKRKLLYGNDHDRADLVEGGGEGYGQREQHRLHTVWRRGALRFLSEKLRTGGQVFKEPPGRSTVTGWPGDLGKHHLVPEELLDLGVISVHVDDAARTYARIHSDRLAAATARFAREAAAAAAATSGAGSANGAAAFRLPPFGAPRFEAAATFAGARPGYVFKAGEQGVGYYADGPDPAAHDEAAPPPLPEGWVEGTSPEGYAYYFHSPTQTSSWERPTAATAVSATVPLSPALTASLTAKRRAGVSQLQADSGAQVLLQGGVATLSGTARAVARAQELLQRKAAALEFVASRSRPAAARPPPPLPPTEAAPDYNFSGLVQPAPPSGGLNLLGAYNSDSDGS